MFRISTRHYVYWLRYPLSFYTLAGNKRVNLDIMAATVANHKTIVARYIVSFALSRLDAIIYAGLAFYSSWGVERGAYGISNCASIVSYTAHTHTHVYKKYKSNRPPLFSFASHQLSPRYTKSRLRITFNFSEDRKNKFFTVKKFLPTSLEIFPSCGLPLFPLLKKKRSLMQKKVV